MDLDEDRRWMKPLIDRVPKPEGGQLAVGGERVTWGSYWQRRLRDADIGRMSDEEIAAAIKAEEDPAPGKISGGKK